MDQKDIDELVRVIMVGLKTQLDRNLGESISGMSPELATGIYYGHYDTVKLVLNESIKLSKPRKKEKSKKSP